MRSQLAQTPQASSSPSGCNGCEAIGGLGQQHGERVLARAARAAQDHRRRQTAGGQGLAQAVHRVLDCRGSR